MKQGRFLEAILLKSNASSQESNRKVFSSVGFNNKSLIEIDGREGAEAFLRGSGEIGKFHFHKGFVDFSFRSFLIQFGDEFSGQLRDGQPAILGGNEIFTKGGFVAQ